MTCILHVLTDIAGLGQGGGIRDCERHVEDPGQGPGEQGLARAGGAGEENIAFFDLDIVELRRKRRGILRGLPGIEEEPLVVIVDRDREDLLGVVLANDEIIQNLLDFRRFHQTDGRLGLYHRLFHLPVDDCLADIDAGVADVDARAGDYLFHFRLRFAAKGTEGHSRRFSHGETGSETGSILNK